MNRYWLTHLVQVDGSKSVGNGRYIEIPRYIGLIVYDNKVSKQLYLDEYNSEVLLRELLGYRNSKVISIYNKAPTLKDIILSTDFNEYMVRHGIRIIQVKEINNYLREQGIVKKQRNANNMHEIAKDIKMGSYR